MLTNLLWLWDAKLQYERQKAQGLSGFIAILSVILLCWKWDEWFYPFFKNIGLIGLAERTGIVSDLSALSIVNVLVVIFFLCLAYALIVFSIICLGILFLMFSSSKIIETIIVMITLPIVAPFLLLFVKHTKKNGLINTYKKDPNLKVLLKKYSHLNEQERNFQLYLEQLKRCNNDFELEKWESGSVEAKEYLNRVVPSIKDDIQWLIGYERIKKKLYILFPNPLPAISSRSFDVYYSGEGLYGFVSQFRNHHYEKYSRQYVPALPIYTDWSGSELTLKVKEHEKVESVILDLDMDYYKINANEIKNFFILLLKIDKTFTRHYIELIWLFTYFQSHIKM